MVQFENAIQFKYFFHLLPQHLSLYYFCNLEVKIYFSISVTLCRPSYIPAVANFYFVSKLNKLPQTFYKLK